MEAEVFEPVVVYDKDRRLWSHLEHVRHQGSVSEVQLELDYHRVFVL